MKYTAYVITKPKEEGVCKWCERAVSLIAYEFHNGAVVGGWDECRLPLPARQHYYKSSGASTIPQIYMVDEDGFSEHVGGYDELVAWLEKRRK